MDQFIHLSRNISSTENNVNICILKVWTAVNRLIIIWKSNLWFNKTKQNKTGFFQAVAMSVLLCGCTAWILMKQRKILDGNYTRMLHDVWNKSYKAAVVQPLTTHLTNHPSKTCWTLLGSKNKLTSCILWTATYGPTSIGRPAKSNISSVWTLDAS